MTPQQILGAILTIIIGGILAHASIEDIRHRDIGSIHVVLLYILVCFYIVITGSLGLETTYLFLFAFILFMGISVFSK
jgi:Flp pilus assembly protein protease CpaA